MTYNRKDSEDTMVNNLDRVFGSSVQEAVQSSLESNKPLFILLSKEDDVSKAFIKKFLFKEENVDEGVLQVIKDRYICLKLVDQTNEMGYFREIFKKVILPSFYIVQRGQLLHMITEAMTQEEFHNKLNYNPTGTLAVPATVGSSSLNRLTRTSRTLSEDGNTPKKQRLVSASPPLGDRSADTKLKNKVLRKNMEAETERIRALLKSDQKERDSLKKERSLQKEAKLDTEEKPKQQRNSDICLLSIRLFNGKALKQDFKSTQTLNDVRSWLDTETNEEIITNTSSMPSFAHSLIPQPTRYAFHRPSLPRITYSDEQEFKTLVDLELCPRSVLILKPIYDEKGFSNSYPDGKTANQSIFSSMGSALSKVGNALYSFFDYGVDNEVNLHREDLTDSETPVVDSMGSSSGHNNYSYVRDDYFQPREETSIDRGTPNIFSIDNLPSIPSPIIRNPSHHDGMNDDIESNEALSGLCSVGNSRTNSPKPINIRSGVQTLQNGVDQDRPKLDNDSQ